MERIEFPVSRPWPRQRLSCVLAALCAVFLCCGRPASAVVTLYQTCIPPPGTNCGSVAIPDSPGPNGTPGTPALMTLTVPSDPAGNLINSVEAHIWIQHTFQGDLRVELISPAGTVVTLLNRPGVPGCSPAGFSADDLGGFTFTTTPSQLYFAPMQFSDVTSCLFSGAVTKYDSPFVACPGYNFTASPQGFPTFCTYIYNPVAPLSILHGESKAGTWTLRVTDLNSGDTGFIRHLGLSIDSCPLTQPVATITAPAAFAVGCSPTTITGTANAPDCVLTGYSLDYSSNPAGPWNNIAAGTSPVINGTLGTWNTTGVSEGYKFVRVTATNEFNLTSTFITVVYVDQGFNGIGVRSPNNGAIMGGLVCPDGSITDFSFVNYRVDYAPPPYSTFNPINPAIPVYTTPIINDPLASWNTASGGAAVPDGSYRIRFSGLDACGNTAVVTRDVIVDNTAPIALISAPASCGYDHGIVPITGTASDLHLAGWTLQYTGGSTHGWVTIASGNSNVLGGLLGNWNTAGLAPCAYTVRLIVSDSASVNCGLTSNSAEYEVSVDVGCPGDFNRSGAISIQDIFDFLAAWFAGCP